MAKANPISDGGGTSGKTDLRMWESCTGGTPQERGVKLCERHNSADTRGSDAGGERGCSRAEVPPQPVVKTTVR